MQKNLLYFDYLKVNIGTMLFAFKEDFSLISIILPNNNCKKSLSILKELVNGVHTGYVFKKRKFIYKGLFIDYFSGKYVNFSKLRYDVNFFNPTVFQKNVWDACRKIKYSSTQTYGDIAKILAKKCYRSIGSALSKNNLPLLIPCHRVVSKNGIGGFSAEGGINMKRRLLSIESTLYPKTI